MQLIFSWNDNLHISDLKQLYVRFFYLEILASKSFWVTFPSSSLCKFGETGMKFSRKGQIALWQQQMHVYMNTLVITTVNSTHLTVGGSKVAKIDKTTSAFKPLKTYFFFFS